jgi:hypothetical protein
LIDYCRYFVKVFNTWKRDLTIWAITSFLLIIIASLCFVLIMKVEREWLIQSLGIIVYYSIYSLVYPYALFIVAFILGLISHLMIIKAFPDFSATPIDDLSYANSFSINLAYDETMSRCKRILEISFPKAEIEVNEINGSIKSVLRYFRKRVIEKVNIHIKRLDSGSTKVTILYQHDRPIFPFFIMDRIIKLEMLPLLLTNYEMDDSSMKSMRNKRCNKYFLLKMLSYVLIVAVAQIIFWLRDRS